MSLVIKHFETELNHLSPYLRRYLTRVPHRQRPTVPFIAFGSNLLQVVIDLCANLFQFVSVFFIYQLIDASRSSVQEIHELSV